jgi:hypothetical protein
MGFNVNRWLKYAQAKLGATVDSANQDLDELEAERAAAVADRPWLADDGAVPSFDEARARIEWEADAQQRAGRSEESTPPAGVPPTSAASARPDPDVAAAQLELDRRAQEASARLDAIREELGVEPPADDATS